MCTPLTPDRMTPLFKSSFGQTYRYLSRTASTQDELTDDDAEGTVVVCEEQWAGRGRRGHEWAAPAGRALLASILLRPGRDRPAAQISLVAGVVTAAVIERELGRPAGIKWPNDVLVGRAKVAGILAEQRDELLVLGIGVNVNQTKSELPARSQIEASSLRVIDGRVRDRAAFLARLVEGIEAGYRAWQASGLAAIADELRERDALRGHRVRVDSIQGVATGIDADGALLLRTVEGERSVLAGSVEVEW